MVKFFGELIRPIEAMKENLNLIEIIEENKSNRNY